MTSGKGQENISRKIVKDWQDNLENKNRKYAKKVEAVTKT